jgi:hypothetical protein
LQDLLGDEVHTGQAKALIEYCTIHSCSSEEQQQELLRATLALGVNAKFKINN